MSGIQPFIGKVVSKKELPKIKEKSVTLSSPSLP